MYWKDICKKLKPKTNKKQNDSNIKKKTQSHRKALAIYNVVDIFKWCYISPTMHYSRTSGCVKTLTE